MKQNTKKLTVSAFFAVLSLTLYAVEEMIPPVFPAVPGLKIGLAYLPIMLIMFIGGVWKARDAALILLCRIVISCLLFGNPMAIMFSVSGGILSLLVMTLFSKGIKDSWEIIPCGIFSALAHNIGQLTAAAVLYKSLFMFAYLPYLAIAAFITGAFSGIVTYILTKRPINIISKIKNLK